MKTVQIDDALFDQAMATAAVEGVNVRDLIESGLRRELKRRHRRTRFVGTAGMKDDAFRDKRKPFSGDS